MGLLAVRSALLSSGKYPPVVSFDFTKLTNLSPQFADTFAFARASNATMVDATGALTTAPNNQVLYSNTFTNSAWTKTNASLSAGVADPFGGNNATTVTASSSSATVQQIVTIQGLNYLSAVWIRRRTGTGTVQITSAGAVYTNVSLSSSWTQVFQTSANDGNTYAGIRILTSGDAVDVYAFTASAVMYETTPRPCDQVITTSAAYYGPRLTSKGLQIEQAATNLFVNSKSPATQNITVTAQPYTLSFYGSGTVTLSGAYSGFTYGPGAWPQSSPALMTFTPTAGTLTITLSGTVQYPQLETGTFPTSYISTGSTSLTRAADGVTAAIAAVGGFNAGAGSMVVEAQVGGYDQLATYAMFNSSGNFNSVGVSKNNVDNNGVGAYIGLKSYDSAFTWIAATGNGNDGKVHRVGVAWGRGCIASADGGVAKSGAARNPVPTKFNLGSADSGMYYPINGYVSKLALWGVKLPASKLQALTIAGAPFI